MAASLRPPIRSVPPDLDSFVAWLGDWSDQLVLLEEFPLEAVRAAVHTSCERVERHRADSDPEPAGAGEPVRVRDLVGILRSDHRWFGASVQEFEGLLRVVEGEDQGGHRQALGQYGRLLAAALVRHRRDEIELDDLRAGLADRPLRNAN